MLCLCVLVPSAFFILIKMLQCVKLPKTHCIAITLPCCLSGFGSESVWTWLLKRGTVVSNACFPFWSPDVNECVTNTHTCQPNERCVNTVGAFMCERQISCSSGYQLRNGVCKGRYSFLVFLFFWHLHSLQFSSFLLFLKVEKWEISEWS